MTQPMQRNTLITDQQDLAAAPTRCVVRAADGTIAARFNDELGVIFGDDRPFQWSALRAPALVLWVDGEPMTQPAKPSAQPEPSPGGMDHSMSVEWDGHGFPTYRLKCAADATSLCRADWKCECEEFTATGIDERGPWHELAEGYMTVEEMRAPQPPRHYGEWGGDCTYDIWVNSSDCTDELGKGAITFPISLSWDGDGYTWEVAK